MTRKTIVVGVGFKNYIIIKDFIKSVFTYDTDGFMIDYGSHAYYGIKIKYKDGSIEDLRYGFTNDDKEERDRWFNRIERMLNE